MSILFSPPGASLAPADDTDDEGLLPLAPDPLPQGAAAVASASVLAAITKKSTRPSSCRHRCCRCCFWRWRLKVLLLFTSIDAVFVSLNIDLIEGVATVYTSVDGNSI